VPVKVGCGEKVLLGCVWLKCPIPEQVQNSVCRNTIAEKRRIVIHLDAAHFLPYSVIKLCNYA